jgi:hypothetical protein
MLKAIDTSTGWEHPINGNDSESMTMTKEHKVGDRVWFVPDRRGYAPQYILIVKVGRKWVTLDGFRKWRFLLTGKIVEEPGFGRVGQWYESQEEWEAIAAQNRTRTALITKLGLSLSSPLRRLSVEDLDAIDRILENAKT